MSKQYSVQLSEEAAGIVDRMQGLYAMEIGCCVSKRVLLSTVLKLWGDQMIRGLLDCADNPAYLESLGLPVNPPVVEEPEICESCGEEYFGHEDDGEDIAGWCSECSKDYYDLEKMKDDENISANKGMSPMNVV